MFRARDERLHRLVALKVLAPALAGDGESRQRFIRESQAAAAVDDPHIIPVFEAGETPAGALFIAMRFVPGGDVYSLVRRTGPLSAPRAAAIVSPVASALDAAHAAGLVHRDVKPANMLLDTRPGRPDHVYLSDFGLSKGTVSTSTRLTGAGHFMGTLDYISPERIEGHQADGRTDQYALACSAFEMIRRAAVPVPRSRGADVRATLAPPAAAYLSAARSAAAADQVFAQALAKTPGIATPVAGTSPTPCARRSTSRPTTPGPNPSWPWSTRPHPPRPGPPPRTMCPDPPRRLPPPLVLPSPLVPRRVPAPLVPPGPLVPRRRLVWPRPLVTPRPLPPPRPLRGSPRRIQAGRSPGPVRSPRRIRTSRPRPPEAIPPRHPGRARSRPRPGRGGCRGLICTTDCPAARWLRSRSPRRPGSRQ